MRYSAVHNIMMVEDSISATKDVIVYSIRLGLAKLNVRLLHSRAIEQRGISDP